MELALSLSPSGKKYEAFIYWIVNGGGELRKT
jgi:hypothetical protein